MAEAEKGLGPCSVCSPPVIARSEVIRATMEPRVVPREVSPVHSGLCQSQSLVGEIDELSL